jgi:hypothetical protein
MINKIFQIGFNKCGTLSLLDIFKNYVTPNINTIHWDGGNLAKTIYYNYCNDMPLLSGYEDYVYFGDMQYQLWKNNKPHKMILPYMNMYSLLDRQYPNSKFILNTRNIDRWLLSRKKWMPGLDNNFYMKAYNLFSDIELKELYIHMWNYHHKNILDYFKDRPEDLLVFNVENDSIEKLKDFFSTLTFIDKLKTMPHLNKTKS